MNYFGRNAAAKSKYIIRDDFGPFRISEAIPWLLIASAFRVQKHVLPIESLALLNLILVQCFVFMAFASTVHSVVTDSGGKSQIGKYSLLAKIGLMKRVIKKVLAMQFFVCIGAVFAIAALKAGGIDATKALILPASFLVSFNGMIYTDGYFLARIASAIVAVMVFLWVIAAATGKPVTWKELGESLSQHGFAMMLAAFFLVGTMQFLNHNQLEFLKYLYVTSSAKHMPLIYLVYQTVFAFIRLWLTIYILTTALKWSYKYTSRT
ncbi:MAG: hypothetical protein AAGA53_14820 [Pseudomonadota bacterium]